MKGKVFIVGAGPGDPRLITVKGVECLHKADVVVYDRLIDPALLEQVRSGVQLIYVGKESGHHPLPQDQINKILAEHVRAGKTVVRLKGGDPFVFGRGGEEASFLAAQGIAFEIIPGVSSALAVPALAGIPVTHRGMANSFAVATGHPRGKDFQVDFLSLYKSAGTLVVLMGVERRVEIAQCLLDGNINPSTPVAIIEQGSRPEQRTIITSLKDIAQDSAGVRPPAVIVIGDVVALRSKMSISCDSFRDAAEDAE